MAPDNRAISGPYEAIPYPGTGISNPFLSSGESTNFRFLSGRARIVEKLSPIAAESLILQHGAAALTDGLAELQRIIELWAIAKG